MNGRNTLSKKTNQMEYQKIVIGIIDVLTSNFDISVHHVGEESRFEDFIFDDIDMESLHVALELEFGIKIPYDKWENITDESTVEEVALMIKELKS